MVKRHKPVAGSRAFWPKKRVKRIYAEVKTWPELSGEKALPLAFAGYKVGCTHVTFIDDRKGSVTQGQEITKSVTVLDCPFLLICGIKIYRKTLEGLKNIATLWTTQLPKDLERKLKVSKKTKTKEFTERDLDKSNQIRLLVCTQPRESGLRKKKPELFEIPLSGSVENQWKYGIEKLGKELRPEEVFAQGEQVDVKAVTKGKGFTGVVKRFGVKIRDRKAVGKRRHIGTLGPVTPRRILPGKIPMSGQLGFQTRTEYDKRILKIGNDGLTPKGGWVNYGVVPKNYILLEGSVPGPKKRLIILRKAMRAKKAGGVEIKSIAL